ncbi:glycosyltransferase family 4 protein [Hymenobacter persicinus]|uniref:Glycosyltransferase family 1 protein n=1 Tax=Hymenobacter persicinus TaxID=2025506 RepID=A0A4Q5L6N2_9BACT|nr:glycosyltransferase family 4 protein [Hymenobacter persicinus]RYU75792.1 glycosyltransferase family 1 protein [Hymenobacter persicinus]
MRILISTWSLQVGGGEVLAMNLAAELSRRGHEVFVFNQRASLIDHDLVKRLLPPAVKVLSMADRPVRSFWANKGNALQQRLGRAATFYDQQQQYLAKCLQRYRIELVSSHSTFSDKMCAGVVKKLGIPMVITEHGDYSAFLLDGRNDFSPVLHQAERILTVSNYCKRKLEQAFNDLPPIQTVYNGVVSQPYDGALMRQQLQIPAGAFVFGMVARGIDKKGWRYAIQAFQRLEITPGGRLPYLVLVGGSDYLRQLQAEYGADPRIVFTGQVPNPDFFVAGFDVGLLPSYFRSEALPLAVIEYMASGKPSVATRVGGVPELLEPATGPTGLLVNIDPVEYTPDLVMLTDEMNQYYHDAALYAAHARNARTASAGFTMAACTDQYEQAFQSAVRPAPTV